MAELQYFFSVCIPIFNAEKFLECCIISVLRQTYENFEVILVDDGSTDSSEKICKKFVEKDSRIRYIKKQNEGQLLTRQLAFKIAKGDVILCLDSDDFIDNNALFLLNNYFNEYGCDCICFDYCKVNENAEIVCKDKRLGEVFFSCNKKEIYEKIFCSSSYNPMWIKAFKRELVPQNDYYEYRNVRIGEDLLHSLKIFEKANSVLFIPDVLYNYRLNTCSVTQKISITKYKDDNIIRPAVYAFLKNENVFSREEWTSFANYQINMLVDWIVRVATLEERLKLKKNLLKEKSMLDVTSFALKLGTCERFSRSICLWLFENKKWTVLIVFCNCLYKMSLLKRFLKDFAK